MGLTTPSPPAGDAALLGPAVHHLLGRGPTAFALGGGAAAPKASQPIPVYVVGLDAIADESFPAKAVPIGWRYMIDVNGPAAVAELRGQGGTEPLSFGRLMHGRAAEQLVMAVRYAEDRYGSTSEAFELRVLEIPALYKSALWLHGSRDVFIPMLETEVPTTAEIREDPTFPSRVVQAAATTGRAPAQPATGP